MTSELVTAAPGHGGGVSRFHASLDAHAVRISVTDRSPVLPRAVPREDAATPEGRGRSPVRRRSAALAVTATADGKTITAVVASL
ncbi:hypothetical protein LUX12_22040 [Streptomyces somaliensis]|uniref:hypothetical protein n=1 Tax=Streptomyces somaliensis TaxID=78355 RepID=UPI0020CC0F39|nr:hypothetical protein [Streptomyces somaliensis]MCP9946882.1 hypothetical protein [Streptomyces somaliensis]